ncbi:hypothetical protein RI662_18255 [Brevibacillus agri]|nr:hypothetical protein [Brevibacillus agri]MDR9506215.1 hypothetical protein [Brevibacillus agri]
MWRSIDSHLRNSESHLSAVALAEWIASRSDIMTIPVSSSIQEVSSAGRERAVFRKW